MTLDSATMRERFAAQSVIEELLRVQGATPPRSRLARMFGKSPLSADSLSWYVGAKGEIVVGSLLETLPPEWTVFHAIPLGASNSNIDHLIVGPGGIFTINTQHHSGQEIWVGKRAMTVGGQTVHCLTNAEFEAERVTTLVRGRMPLLAPVQPVVALLDPKQLTIAEKPDQVKVIDAHDLRRWLVNLHPVLSAGEVQEVADLIDSPHNWRELPEATPEDLMKRFSALDARVRAAGIRRVLWVLLAGATAIGGSYLALRVLDAVLSAG
jgi:hypothetical protein